MKLSLLKGLDEKELKEIKGLWKEAHRIRSLLASRLKEKQVETQEFRLSKRSFEHGAWAYEQAETNGYERAIMELISLLEDNDEK